MLLDTSFLIDLMRGDEGAIDAAQSLEANLVQQRLSSMTLFELHHGVARSTRSETERDAIIEILESKPVHPADSVVMRTAGRISGELMTQGEPVPDGDVIIGATAALLDEPVLTRNTGDFDRVADIEVHTY